MTLTVLPHDSRPPRRDHRLQLLADVFLVVVTEQVPLGQRAHRLSRHQLHVQHDLPVVCFPAIDLRYGYVMVSKTSVCKPLRLCFADRSLDAPFGEEVVFGVSGVYVPVSWTPMRFH